MGNILDMLAAFALDAALMVFGLISTTIADFFGLKEGSDQSGAVKATFDFLSTVFTPGDTAVDSSSSVATIFQSANVLTYFQAAGFGIILLFLLINLFRSFFGDLNGSEHPITILIRTLISTIVISTYHIWVDFIVSTVFAPMYIAEQTTLTKMTEDNAFLAFKSVFEANPNIIQYADGSAEVGSMLRPSLTLSIITFIIIMMLGQQFIMLSFEICERYLVLFIIIIFGPICLSFGCNKNTKKISANWVSMFLSELVLMILNVFFLSSFLLGFKNLAKLIGSGDMMTLSKTIAISILLYAWLKTGQKMDEHMSRLGFTVAQTGNFGGDLFRGIVGTAAAGKGISKALTDNSIVKGGKNAVLDKFGDSTSAFGKSVAQSGGILGVAAAAGIAAKGMNAAKNPLSESGMKTNLQSVGNKLSGRSHSPVSAGELTSLNASIKKSGNPLDVQSINPKNGQATLSNGKSVATGTLSQDSRDGSYAMGGGMYFTPDRNTDPNNSVIGDLQKFNNPSSAMENLNEHIGRGSDVQEVSNAGNNYTNNLDGIGGPATLAMDSTGDFREFHSEGIELSRFDKNGYADSSGDFYKTTSGQLVPSTDINPMITASGGENYLNQQVRTTSGLEGQIVGGNDGSVVRFDSEGNVSESGSNCMVVSRTETGGYSSTIVPMSNLQGYNASTDSAKTFNSGNLVQNAETGDFCNRVQGIAPDAEGRVKVRNADNSTSWVMPTCDMGGEMQQFRTAERIQIANPTDIIESSRDSGVRDITSGNSTISDSAGDKYNASDFVSYSCNQASTNSLGQETCMSRSGNEISASSALNYDENSKSFSAKANVYDSTGNQVSSDYSGEKYVCVNDKMVGLNSEAATSAGIYTNNGGEATFDVRSDAVNYKLNERMNQTTGATELVSTRTGETITVNDTYSHVPTTKEYKTASGIDVNQCGETTINYAINNNSNGSKITGFSSCGQAVEFNIGQANKNANVVTDVNGVPVSIKNTSYKDLQKMQKDKKDSN